ncbi:MAG TPA: hypothetical protein VF172_07445 [Nitrososphaera sp.]
MMLIRCYTCKLVFDVDKPEQRKEAIRHSQQCHEMTQGFRA